MVAICRERSSKLVLLGARDPLFDIAGLLFGMVNIVNVAIMRNLSEFIMFAVLLFFVIKYRKQFALEQKNNQSLSGDDNTNK